MNTAMNYLIRLNKICLNETNSKQLSDTCAIQNSLKQGEALSPSLSNFGLEYSNRKDEQRQEGVILNEEHQLVAYADVNSVSENKHIIKEFY
jgi:hypothetical protein